MGLYLFSNNMRLFLFKMHTNILGLNNRVAHFIHDHSPICTFCRIRLLNDAPDESTLHLFYECPSVIIYVRVEFFKWWYNENYDYIISRQELFLVQCEDGKSTSTSLTKTVLAKICLKYIWDCRNRYCLPNLGDAKETVTQDIIQYLTEVK
jgi:hypothetical protein